MRNNEKNKSFHWRNIDASEHLQRVLQILKDASVPLSGLDIILESQRRGFAVVNAGTDINEIGKNPGYRTSGGVLFPNRKYYYWLIAAPNWSPRWTVTEDFRVVPVTSHAPACSDDVPQITICKAPGCGKELPAGAPFCDEDCRQSWFASMQVKLF